MANEVTTPVDLVGPLKGFVFVVMMILACMFANDSRLNTAGHYENRLNSAQRIEFQSGSYFSGTARVICFQTTRPSWISQDVETVKYWRNGSKVTLSGTSGNAEFEISNKSLTDSEGVIWDRKFSGD